MLEKRAKTREAATYTDQARALQSVGKHLEAMECYKKALAIVVTLCDRTKEVDVYTGMAKTLQCLSKKEEALKWCEQAEEALFLSSFSGGMPRNEEAYTNLGNTYQFLGEHQKALECYDNALTTALVRGEKAKEAEAYKNMANTLQALGEHQKALECYDMVLTTAIMNGDKAKEVEAYTDMANTLQALGKHEKALECHDEALMAAIISGETAREEEVYTNMANMLQAIGNLQGAMLCHENALMAAVISGDMAREGKVYINMANTLQSQGNLEGAMNCYDQARMAAVASGDMALEAEIHDKMANTLQYHENHREAIQCYEESRIVAVASGDQGLEADCSTNIANALQRVGNYAESIESHEDARMVAVLSGDRNREAASNTNVAETLHCLDEHRLALDYHDEALFIAQEIGDRQGESVSYGNVGTTLQFLGENRKALECHAEALTITQEIGDKENEAASYRNLGSTWQCLGSDLKARDCHMMALSISEAIGDRRGEAASYGNLGAVFEPLGEYSKAEECHEKAIQLSKKNPLEALHIVEMARARSLAHLMAIQYFGKQFLVTPKSMLGIERIMNKEPSCVCLYISYVKQDMSFWILKTSGVKYRTINVCQDFDRVGAIRNFSEFFAKFRRFSVPPLKNCEDRSLSPVFERRPTAHSSLTTVQDKVAALRLGEADENEPSEPEQDLCQGYQMIVSPVADLLHEPEIIIVPDRCLFNVPFAALKDENGRYLSETYRIRIAPSLTTLKLIQDSPVSYHSRSGALIVGDPQVGDVVYQGRIVSLTPLPSARREAERIGRLLGVQPLLGEHATKRAVLQRIHSVSLIHFAAHGDAERGEIALAPVRSSNGIPQQQDYLLTMSDISKVRLQAKLVVLSCCHSARGDVRVEGVVGIARAFLASGARSVLVALWAIDDEATEQFMNRFYACLARGRSASEALHQTMKWMRVNGFPEVGQWAPFLLIGDNVKLFS